MQFGSSRMTAPADDGGCEGSDPRFAQGGRCRRGSSCAVTSASICGGSTARSVPAEAVCHRALQPQLAEFSRYNRTHPLAIGSLAAGPL